MKRKKEEQPDIPAMLAVVLANQRVILEWLDTERKARERLHKHLGVPIPQSGATAMYPGMGSTDPTRTYGAVYRG